MQAIRGRTFKWEKIDETPHRRGRIFHGEKLTRHRNASAAGRPASGHTLVDSVQGNRDDSGLSQTSGPVLSGPLAIWHENMIDIIHKTGST